MFLSIDRIENDIAVCEKEDMTFVNICLSDLPNNIHEGTILREDNGKYILDEDEEKRRKDRILDLQKNIFKNKKNL